MYVYVKLSTSFQRQGERRKERKKRDFRGCCCVAAYRTSLGSVAFQCIYLLLMVIDAVQLGVYRRKYEAAHETAFPGQEWSVDKETDGETMFSAVV